MSELNRMMVEQYRNNFLKEVEAEVEQGQWTRMCIQCGACAGSCPLGDAWEHSPQALLMMIRAGRRDEVLGSDSMWMCTACYSCTVRCPSQLPVTQLMHGLAGYAERLGLAPKENPTRRFALRFWDNLNRDGRVNEPRLGLGLYFMNGFVRGVKNTIKMAGAGTGMALAGRMNPLQVVGGHSIEDKSGFRRMLARAETLGSPGSKKVRPLVSEPAGKQASGATASREYSFYPGCSSQKGASSSNYLKSVETLCDQLDIGLNVIPDWNCCSASIGHAGGGELSRLALSARNIALSEKANPGQDIVASCAACWLATREAKQRLERDQDLLAETNTALAEAGLKLELEDRTRVRHMVEVLIEDIGWDELASHVTKPLDGIKVAGYVGCQTNRPFGIDGESFENPQYLDKLTATLGAEPIENYERKVQCCGGALAFSEPQKSQALIKDIIEAACDGGADMIVTPCPVCQMNVEVYQHQINARYGTRFSMPVVYYSQLMAVAYGSSAKEAGLNGQVIRARQLEDVANKS